MDFHFLLQGIFPTQGSNPGLPHCRQTLYRPIKKKKDNYSDLVQRFSTGGSFVLPAPREHLAMSEETSSCDLCLGGERVPLGSSGKMPAMLLSILQCLGQPPTQRMILTCGAEAEKLEGLDATGQTWSEHACSVAQSCPTLSDPMGFSPPGSSLHGISQARILEWVAISSPKGSFQSRDRTHVPCTSCRWILYH